MKETSESGQRTLHAVRRKGSCCPVRHYLFHVQLASKLNSYYSVEAGDAQLEDAILAIVVVESIHRLVVVTHALSISRVPGQNCSKYRKRDFLYRRSMCFGVWAVHAHTWKSCLYFIHRQRHEHRAHMKICRRHLCPGILQFSGRRHKY